ncbi:MAG: metallopeptidase TldD-related protein [Gemmatimonadaceae bacterium]|nr:metallopeptidase TldD-related protein [Gemmatimonadaceae bacterium]
MWSRRNFLRAGAAVTAGVLLPAPVRGSALFSTTARRLDDSEIKELALRGIDAARAAGASYADARLTRIRRRIARSLGLWGPGLTGTAVTQRVITEHEAVAIGVRALRDGSWGFAASTVWSGDEAVRLGREAVAQATTNTTGTPRVVELATVPIIRDGHWTMPVEIDPFTVPQDEILDVLASFAFFSLKQSRVVLSGPHLAMAKRETAFASSEGSYATQVLFGTGGSFTTGLPAYESTPFPDRTYNIRGFAPLETFPLAGRGWEYFAKAPLQEEIERVIAEADEEDRLPLKPLEVGRYDTVFDAVTTGRLLDGTIGVATELDRALGYEANAGGTSYLDSPLAMLGNHQVGSPLLTVTADRSMPGGAATVKWDEEGVEPEDFILVKDGVLVDFQTTRESAGWLAEAYARAGRTPRSHGCAGATSALGAQQLQRPNLRLASGTERVGFEALAADVKDGIAVRRAAVDMDFNALNGMVVQQEGFRTMFFEIKRGKKVARLQPNAVAVLVRAPELWKSVAALGGQDSLQRAEGRSVKGEPPQTSYHTVEAPPMLVQQLAVIDPAR